MSVEPGPNDQVDPAIENFLPPVSQAVLDRHGGRVLNPEEVWVAEGWAAPRSTVYKTNSLLVPQRFLPQVVRAYNDPENSFIRESGMTLFAEEREPEFGQYEEDLPRRVTVRRGTDPGPNVVIDCWVALQYLRQWSGLDRDTVNQVTVEHLLFAGALQGSPWGVPW
jgi:hypothetical protein